MLLNGGSGLVGVFILSLQCKSKQVYHNIQPNIWLITEADCPRLGNKNSTKISYNQILGKTNNSA